MGPKAEVDFATNDAHAWEESHDHSQIRSLDHDSFMSVFFFDSVPFEPASSFLWAARFRPTPDGPSKLITGLQRKRGVVKVH